MVKNGMLKKNHFDNSVLFFLESVIVEDCGVIRVIHRYLNLLPVWVCYLIREGTAEEMFSFR